MLDEFNAGEMANEAVERICKSFEVELSNKVGGVPYARSTSVRLI